MKKSIKYTLVTLLTIGGAFVIHQRTFATTNTENPNRLCLIVYPTTAYCSGTGTDCVTVGACLKPE